MDNLAHGLTAGVVGALLAPELAKQHKTRFLMTCAIIANLPDIDIVLALIDTDIYFFHHRGLTHSFIGLLLMIPLAMWVFQTLIGTRICQEPYRLSTAKLMLLVSVQLVFSHYLLDYFTTYGTMLLYPLTMERYAFPLMFIIDPFYWGVMGLGFIALYRVVSVHALKTSAVLTLLAVTMLWAIEWSFKREAEQRFSQFSSQPIKTIHSYPAPLGPLVWSFVGITENQSLHQGAVSFFTAKEPGYWDAPVPSRYQQNQLCSHQTYTPSAQAAFEQYHLWSEFSACGPHTYQAPGYPQPKNGCRCINLKYALPGIEEEVLFGSYWIDAEGNTAILPRNRRQVFHAFKAFYQSDPP